MGKRTQKALREMEHTCIAKTGAANASKKVAIATDAALYALENSR